MFINNKKTLINIINVFLKTILIRYNLKFLKWHFSKPNLIKISSTRLHLTQTLASQESWTGLLSK